MRRAAFRVLAVVLLALQPLTPSAYAVDTESDFMTEAQIRSELIGHEMRGYYRNGERWVDDYAPDGGIKYADAQNNWTGRWSFQNDVFCTFYNAGVDGGCYLMRKVSRNCYEYVTVPNDWSKRAVPAGMSSDWFARGWAHDAPATCDDPLLS